MTITKPSHGATGWDTATDALIDAYNVLDPNTDGGLDAGRITSGTVAPARLGSGTASSSTFLAGDSTYKSGTESATYTGTKTITGRFAVNKTSSLKQPVNMGADMVAGTVVGTSTNDKVAFELSSNVSGNFTGDTGANAGFFWGINGFFTTGTASGDGTGLTDIVGALLEMDVQTPAGHTFPLVRGFQCEASFFGASAGATVTQMESCRIGAPKRKDGATAGTATNVYGLFVESTDSADNPVGATNAWSLFVEGGVSRLQGRVDIDGTLLSFNGTLSLQGDYSGSGKITLTTNNIGFFGATPVAQQSLPSSGSVTAANIRQALINLGLCV